VAGKRPSRKTLCEVERTVASGVENSVIELIPYSTCDVAGSLVVHVIVTEWSVIFVASGPGPIAGGVVSVVSGAEQSACSAKGSDSSDERNASLASSAYIKSLAEVVSSPGTVHVQ